MQLENKAAIVTGGGRGIGRAIALAFAREGADVCVTARTRSEIDEVAEQIRRMGRRAVAAVCDVSDLTAVEAAVATAAAELGRIDILVNNAGGGVERKFVGDDDPAIWAKVIEVNLLGTYYFSRAVLPHMKQAGGGTIINVGSGMGHQARAGNTSYNTSKAAMWMFTRCLALEVWRDNITVNELIPGPVETELTASQFSAGRPHPLVESEWVKEPEDVVPLALFLATQPPKGPTGQSFSLARRPL
jgi:3-oxoacyl-[acyl-carrier protein] reductase